MSEKSISVTEAARNFSDCINRARYQGTTFIIHKGGKPVARIVPTEQKLSKGLELGSALEEALKDVHISKENAAAWLNELEEARTAVPPPIDRWRS